MTTLAHRGDRAINEDVSNALLEAHLAVDRSRAASSGRHRLRPALKSLLRRVVPGWIRDWRATRFRARVDRVTPRVVAAANGRVIGGPFSGMHYVSRSHCSQLAPKLLGTYEREWHDVLADLVSSAPDRIVDAGAAEGYFAVGLLRLMPSASVVAFEAESAARADLLALAALNGFTERLDARGRCDAPELAGVLEASSNPLVVMDIEGGEREVLDPALIPALGRARILVELHPALVPDVREVLVDRFAATHRVRYIAAVDRDARGLPALDSFSREDMLAAVWEGRAEGQGWLWMEPLTTPSGRGA